MELVQISTELVWLRWSNFRHRNLTRLSLKNLRVLQLYKSDCLEELWEAGSDAPVQLRELIISGCRKFQRFPNSIGCLNELKKIVFSGYETNINVKSLPEEFCRLQLLEHLDLKNCGELSSLPSNFGNLTNLQYLDLTFCEKLRRLPDSFKNLTLLRYLNLEGCSELILASDDFQNITKLEFLSLPACEKVKELPCHITNQASLRELDLSGMERLKELPIEIGQLGRLQKLDIGSDLLISLPNSLGDLSSLTHLAIYSCPNLESLPTSLGDLSSLTHLRIERCPKLKSLPSSLGYLSSLTHLTTEDCSNLEFLPTSLGDLFSMTHLKIHHCPELKCLPFSVGRLSLLQHLDLCSCSIIQVDFETAPSSSALSNLKGVEIRETGVCSISISDRYPQLESLKLHYNNHLTQIEALPAKLECLYVVGSPQLVVLPSFARLTSLRAFELQGCDQNEKIEGLEHCTRLETLRLHTSWEVAGIESLEHMERLKKVELRANKGSAIVSCIQRLQKWPDEIIICTRAVSDVPSLVDSFKLGLSPNFSVKENMENIFYGHSSNGNAIMLCFVINILEEYLDSMHGGYTGIAGMRIGEGKWALMGVFTKRSRWLTANIRSVRELKHNVNVVRSLAVSGEEQRLVEAFLPLLQTISM